LGISTATVSRALNKPHLLSARTVERVRAAADEMRYRPNFLAQHLKSGRTHNVLVVMPRLSPFFLEVFTGVERAANELGYFAIIAHSGRDPQREAEYFDQVSSGRADGVLLLSSAFSEKPRGYKYKLPPIVSVLDVDPLDDFPSISIDHKAAAVSATLHLIRLGHRRIAHITGNLASPMALRRKQGFLEAMTAAGLAVDDGSIVVGDFTPESGEAAARAMLARRHRPTAIFAANDETAVGAIKAILEAGLRVPEDISVIGFDNQRLGRLYTPALTTVGVPSFALGFEGMKRLIALINGKPVPHAQVLETRVIARATTASPSNPS
jgi:LacI family repressor for deo operon, udp, cdd, tsx, nupC, and nupG